MPASHLLANARIVNEGRIVESDVLIEGDRIARIGGALAAPANAAVTDLEGRCLLPGLIDDQVHFREPGLTHKGSIATESLAAVCGGVTSVLDMPNTRPPTVDRQRLIERKALAAKCSHTNYGFYFGATNDNAEEIGRLADGEVCGIKVFMGASTGNMLVDDPEALAAFFAQARFLVATHCEDSPMIKRAEAAMRARYGEDVPMSAHAEIRSAEACYKSTALAVELAKRYGTRLHVLHLSTARELELFDAGPSLADKRITAEACVHHLWFDDSRYRDLGTLIKCNPAIKTAADRDGLLDGVRRGAIDVIATDHAPHTLEEKRRTYFDAPAGLPLVQHSLAALLEHFRNGALGLELIVRKAAHNPAEIFRIVDRGFVREGYFADLVVVDLTKTTTVSAEQLRYKCGWSPFDGVTFHSSVDLTFVNGSCVYRSGEPSGVANGRALAFAGR